MAFVVQCLVLRIYIYEAFFFFLYHEICEQFHDKELASHGF